jgi:cysteine desulfurase
MSSRIYLDYAAATPLSSAAWMAMQPIFTDHFGNPSSLHAEGVRAKQALGKARQIVASCIGAHDDEIVFTSGATEAINLAIAGTLKAGILRGKHVVTLGTEHIAVLRAMYAFGADVTTVPIDADGSVDVDDVIAAIRPDTVLVSVMTVNNEFGGIQDVRAIGKAIEGWRKKNGSVYPLFHTDASQAPNYLALHVNKDHVDLLTLSSSKVYGPKGVGALFLRRNIPWESVFGGGKQESGRRPGTENVAGAVGFASALFETVHMREREGARVTELRDRFIEGLLKIDGVVLNGDRVRRVPNNVNVSIAGCDSEEMVLRLDAAGIACSAGSACAKGEAPSHALRALGLSDDRVRSSIRFSLGRFTTREEIDRVIVDIKQIINLVRKERY